MKRNGSNLIGSLLALGALAGLATYRVHPEWLPLPARALVQSPERDAYESHRLDMAAAHGVAADRIDANQITNDAQLQAFIKAAKDAADKRNFGPFGERTKTLASGPWDKAQRSAAMRQRQAEFAR